MDTNENVANKQQGSMKGNVFGCAEFLSWETNDKMVGNDSSKKCDKGTVFWSA
jgi:hypothetical protein